MSVEHKTMLLRSSTAEWRKNTLRINYRDVAVMKLAFKYN
uniref:Uncharacterized protein n=1 Tax=Anguilla anguilla TaxID=7936 RepID=A0A0E9PQ30_ANGAN